MKKEKFYIGLDVGTSGCKAAVVDGFGNILKTARREYAFDYPGKGLVELNPDIVWKCVEETLFEIGSYGYDIRMMSVSSIGESMVMLDNQGKVIRNGIVYLDERGPETVDEMCEKISADRVQRITGVPPYHTYSINRYLWMKKHEPESIERAELYFLFGDYITYKLTGKRMIDYSSASKTCMLDVNTFDWSVEIADLFGIPIEKFSKVVPTGTNAGTILSDFAEKSGLPNTMEVIIGCHDQCAAALGAGCINKGDMFAGEGSSECLAPIITQENLTDAFYGKGICIEPHIIPGTFIVPVGQYAHGTCIRWFVEEFYSDLKDDNGKSKFEIANELCAEDAEDLYFLPYLSRSNIMDAENHSRGLFIGMEFETNRSKMYRALLEGLCYESQYSLDVLKSTAIPVDEISNIVAVGGCSKSEIYMQMKADILGKKISILKTADAGIIALVMICAVADGLYKNYDEAKEVFIENKKTFLPQKDYTEKFKKFLKIREAAKLLYNEI